MSAATRKESVHRRPRQAPRVRGSAEKYLFHVVCQSLVLIQQVLLQGRNVFNDVLRRRDATRLRRIGRHAESRTMLVVVTCEGMAHRDSAGGVVEPISGGSRRRVQASGASPKHAKPSKLAGWHLLHRTLFDPATPRHGKTRNMEAKATCCNSRLIMDWERFAPSLGGNSSRKTACIGRTTLSKGVHSRVSKRLRNQIVKGSLRSTQYIGTPNYSLWSCMPSSLGPLLSNLLRSPPLQN